MLRPLWRSCFVPISFVHSTAATYVPVECVLSHSELAVCTAVLEVQRSLELDQSRQLCRPVSLNADRTSAHNRAALYDRTERTRPSYCSTARPQGVNDR